MQRKPRPSNLSERRLNGPVHHSRVRPARDPRQARSGGMSRYSKAVHANVRTAQPTHAERMARRSRHARAKGPAEPLLSARRIRFATIILVLLCLVGGALFAMTSPMFAVRKLQVNGLATLTPEEAEATQQLVSIPPRTNLLRARVGKTVGALSRLPWVAGVTTAKHLPGTIEFNVRPRVPACFLETPDGRWELDVAGRVIRSARSGVELPRIASGEPLEVRPGGIPDSAGLAGAIKAAGQFGSGSAVRAAVIDVDQNGELCLNMTDNVAIRLGSVDDLDAKLEQVRKIYASRADIGSEVESIDLRTPDSPSAVPRGKGKGTERPTAGPSALSGNRAGDRSAPPNDRPHTGPTD
jgi:cell division septal protein FtsQ